MSLDWNVGDVDNYEERCFEERADGKYLKAKTDALIWATMGIGMDHISADNAEEFAARCMMREDVVGTHCRRYEEDLARWVDCPITYEDVVSHIGLYTNASRWTQAQFHKQMIEKLRNIAETNVRLQKGKLEVEETA